MRVTMICGSDLTVLSLFYDANKDIFQTILCINNYSLFFSIVSYVID